MSANETKTNATRDAGHPTFLRMRARARGAGSSATTLRGVAKYIAGLSRKHLSLSCPTWKKPAHMSVLKTYRSDWERSVTLRHTDTEARRARDDAQFRRGYLARLTREETALCHPDLSTLSALTAAVDNLRARQARLAEIARLRGLVTGKPGAAKTVSSPDSGTLVPVTPELARRKGAEIKMIGKDAQLILTRKSSRLEYMPGETTWENGKPVSYTRTVADNYVRSFGMIDARDQRVLHYALHTGEYEICLPDGYFWDVDANGLRAVHGADDYHPDAGDLVAENAENLIADKLAENARKRSELKARAVAEYAEVEGVFVCLADSLRAGNCRAGSESFAQRHGIDPRRHYRALELLGMANGDASRVRLAVSAAILRHKREMAQGFAVLAEHRA